jgi:hypothetical protein
VKANRWPVLSSFLARQTSDRKRRWLVGSGILAGLSLLLAGMAWPMRHQSEQIPQTLWGTWTLARANVNGQQWSGPIDLHRANPFGMVIEFAADGELKLPGVPADYGIVEAHYTVAWGTSPLQFKAIMKVKPSTERRHHADRAAEDPASDEVDRNPRRADTPLELQGILQLCGDQLTICLAERSGPQTTLEPQAGKIILTYQRTGP